MNMKKIIRITTVPISLKILLKGQPKFMSSYYEVLGISSGGQELLDVSTDEGIRVLPVEMTRTISPLKDLKSLYILYRILKKEKPFIVHTHTPKAGIIGMLASKLVGVPNRLHTVAGLPLMEATGNKRRLLDFVEKMTYKCATKVYPNSNELYHFILKNNYAKSDKLKVLGNGSSNGINTSFFDPNVVSETDRQKLKSTLNISDEDFVYVFVGRLVGDKGINELVKAFTQISEKNVKLLLVGPLESDLDKLETQVLKTIESNDKIISTGYQKDVRTYLSISDALVFPSYREGFPNVVLQAGAMGLPSIVTNINGCNEIIVKDINGTIISVKNMQMLYDAMMKFYLDKNYFLKLKSNARQMITSRYEQNVIWNAILSEYKNFEKNV
ncbi:glycosyltransferase family 4 protein [Flavobacterium ginsenosidimutans]|nr:glycosyltransferase family 4 protein [Flavobacterium ginsenosidimutans]